MATRTLDVTLKLPGEPEALARATVEEWSVFDRFRRAVVYLGICWAAAGVAIFFPVVHFVLVPSLLLGGPIFATLKALEAATLRKLEGDCPRCKAPGQFVVGGRFKPQRNVTCDGCGNLLALTAAQ